MIFDVKMEYLRRKAELVSGGHVTEHTATITYPVVVSRDTVMIKLTLAALNDFPVKVADIQNAYATVPVTEKIQKIRRPEFGEYFGSKAIAVCSLYGLKIDGSKFWDHFTDCMQNLGFLPCPSDPYFWMKPIERP